MKLEEVIFPNINVPILFKIGTDAKTNIDTIRTSNDDDIWIHALNVSSCLLYTSDAADE